LLFLFCFKSLCIIENIFSILSFNIWLIVNWILSFFQRGCFQSNDLGYGFEKLTWVDIIPFFFTYFLFSFHHSTLYIYILSFVIFFPIGYLNLMIGPRVWHINLGWLDPYYSGYKFFMLTRVDSNFFLIQFHHSLFNKSIIELHCFSLLKKKRLFFSNYHDFFLIWSICCCCFFFII